jgi:outer membrane lipoprotein-sorting protein
MKTFMIVLACASPLAAQNVSPQSDSAKAAAVVARHTAAVGGAAALRALKQFHTVTTMSMTAPGAPEVRSELYAKVPNLVYMKADMPGIGVMEMAFDGKTAWSMSAAAGPMIHDDVPKDLTDAANFGSPPFAGLKLTYVGRRQIGGRTFDAVRAIMPDSQTMTHYFDVSTGLLAGMDTDGAPPPPPNRMTVAFEDYRRFDGIMRATKITTVMQGQEIVMRTVSVSHEPFDAKIFSPPPAVQQLREKPPHR